MVQRLRLPLPVQGAQVQSWVRELRSHVPHGMAKKKKKNQTLKKLPLLHFFINSNVIFVKV